MFDLVLIWLILASVAVVVLDSFESLHERWGPTLTALEWFFTVIFTLEYIARLSAWRGPLLRAQRLRHHRSGRRPADLAALFVPGLHALIDVRLLRLLRLFRILKLAEYVDEYGALGQALMASRRKILVFLSFVLLVVVVMGTAHVRRRGPRATASPTSRSRSTGRSRR